MKNLKIKFCILMMCLLSGCTLKRVYYPAFTSYDMYGRPVVVYDYYYVNLDDPKSARHANPYIVEQPVVLEQKPSDCACNTPNQ